MDRIQHLLCIHIIDKLEIDFISINREIGKAEYNIADGGQGGNLDEKWHEKLQAGAQKLEHREKINRAIKGKNHPMFGKTHSDKTKKKISEKLQGHKPTQGFTGLRHTNESKRKMSETQKTGEKIFYFFRKTSQPGNKRKNTLRETCEKQPQCPCRY